MSGVGITGNIKPLNGGNFTVFNGNPVPDLATLALLAGGETGTQMWVQDQAEFYQLDVANAFTAHPQLVIAAAGGGRWFRKSKAYVVGNFTLWCGTFVSSTQGGVSGFTAGQLLTSGAKSPDIALDMHIQTNTTGNQQGVITDALGNLWLLVNGDSFLSIAIYKYLLKDCLKSGAPPIALTIPITVSSDGSECAIAAFDHANGLWAANGTHGTPGKSQVVRYGVRAYAATSGVPSIDIIVDPAAGSTSNQQDMVFDSLGNLWGSIAFTSAGANGGVWKLTPTQLAASNAGVEPDVFWTGSNFDGTSLAGTCQMAIAPNGLLWISDLPGNRLRAWDMSLPSGNPAAAIVLTGISVYSIAIDIDGNLWCVPADGSGTLKRIPKANLTASGVAVPDITITAAGAGLGPKISFPNNPDRVGLLPAGFPPGM